MQNSSCHLPFPCSKYEPSVHTTHNSFAQQFPNITLASIETKTKQLYKTCIYEDPDYAWRLYENYRNKIPLYEPKPIPTSQLKFRCRPRFFQIPERQQNWVDIALVNRNKLAYVFRFGTRESSISPFTFRFGAPINMIDQEKMVMVLRPVPIATSSHFWNPELIETIESYTVLMMNGKRRRGEDLFEYPPNKKRVIEKLVSVKTLDISKKNWMPLRRKMLLMSPQGRKDDADELMTFFINEC